MTIQTRDWRAADLEKVLELNQDSQPNVNGLSLPDLRSMAEKSACFRVVELDGRFAGFALTFLPEAEYASENLRWFNQHYADFLYLDRVAIAGFARQRGCGAALYRDVEIFCREKHIGHIALEVNVRPINQGSLDFHYKMGFKEVGIQDTGGGAKTVSLMMKTVSD